MGTLARALSVPLSVLLLSACGMSSTSTSSYTTQSSIQSGGGGGGGGGGSGGGSGQPPAGAAVNPTGIWDITDKVNNQAISEVAMIATGQYYSTATMDQFGCADLSAGTYAVDGNSFVGSGVMQLLNNCNAPNGQNYLPYTLVNGYVLNAGLNVIFEADGTLVPTLGATMDPLYSEPSSLAQLAGSWTDGGNTVTINADGTFFEQQASGCVINGTLTIIDPTHNLYAASLEVTNCTSSTAGIAFTGLGYLNDSNPNAWQFLAELSGPNPAAGGAAMIIFVDYSKP